MKGSNEIKELVTKTMSTRGKNRDITGIHVMHKFGPLLFTNDKILFTTYIGESYIN